VLLLLLLLLQRCSGCGAIQLLHTMVSVGINRFVQSVLDYIRSSNRIISLSPSHLLGINQPSSVNSDRADS
jgi:hypothetical protein